MKLKESINKGVYWALCTILIISLFLLIGGGAAIITERGLGVECFVALLFGVIGAILVIVSLYRPIALFGLAKPPSWIKEKSILKRIQIFYMAWGFSVVIGGIYYLRYSNIYVLLLFMLLPVAVIQALKLRLKFRRRK